MRALRAGAIVLSIWCVLEALVALVVTAATLAGRAPPALALVMSEERIAAADPDLVAVVNAQASIANPLIVSLTIAVLVITWKALVVRARWALPALAAILGPLQVFGFVSDAYLGGRNWIANGVSSVVLAVALGLAAVGLRRSAD